MAIVNALASHGGCTNHRLSPRPRPAGRARLHHREQPRAAAPAARGRRLLHQPQCLVLRQAMGARHAGELPVPPAAVQGGAPAQQKARSGVHAVLCTLWGAGCGVQAVGCCCGVHAVGCMLFEAEHQPNTRHQAPQGCLVRTACSPGCTFSGQPSDQQRPRCMSGIGSDHQSLDPCRTLRARLAAGCLRSAGFAWSTRTAPPPPRPTLPCRA